MASSKINFQFRVMDEEKMNKNFFKKIHEDISQISNKGIMGGFHSYANKNHCKGFIHNFYDIITTLWEEDGKP